MNEWTIFLVVGELLVFIITIVKPLLKLNTTMVKLNDSITRLDKSFDKLSDKNDESHKRMWSKLDEHEDVLNEHETEIQILKRMRDEK